MLRFIFCSFVPPSLAEPIYVHSAKKKKKRRHLRISGNSIETAVLLIKLNAWAVHGRLMTAIKSLSEQMLLHLATIRFDRFQRWRSYSGSLRTWCSHGVAYRFNKTATYRSKHAQVTLFLHLFVWTLFWHRLTFNYTAQGAWMLRRHQMFERSSFRCEVQFISGKARSDGCTENHSH